MFQVTRSRPGEGIKYSREEGFQTCYALWWHRKFPRRSICHLWAARWYSQKTSVALGIYATWLVTPHRSCGIMEVLEPEVLQSKFGVNFLFWPGEFSEKWPANFDDEFFGLVFTGLQVLQKHSRPKFSPKIVGIPLQFQSSWTQNVLTVIFCLRGRPKYGKFSTLVLSGNAWNCFILCESAQSFLPETNVQESPPKTQVSSKQIRAWRVMTTVVVNNWTDKTTMASEWAPTTKIIPLGTLGLHVIDSFLGNYFS